jgi:hypothetical protein
MAEGEKFQADPSDDPNPGVPNHALPDDAKGPHPLADPANDPTPGVAGHAKDDGDESDSLFLQSSADGRVSEGTIHALPG